MMLTKGSGIRTERESGMRLNPEYKLLAVGEHDLLVNEKSDRYFEIDAAAAALIRRIEYAEKTSDHVSVGTAGERTDKISDDADEAVLTTWLAGKKILLEDGEVVPKSRSENRLKEITKIRLFSIPVNDFFESHHRADRIARSERLPAMITVFSVIGLLLMLGGAGFLVLEGQYLPREATAAQVLWMMPAVYILGLLITWFHELGHVLLCRHYCHYVGRCGLMLFFFTPAFYTNTTVSQFAGKKERTEIILAGIRMQLILGGILSALTVWSAAMGWKAGLLFFLLNILNVIYVILNLNPLFKYDGYWLLAVRWNIGHLYERSVYEVIRRLKKFGKKEKTDRRLFLYGSALILFYLGMWSAVIAAIWNYLYPRIYLYSLILVGLVVILIIKEMFGWGKSYRRFSEV